MRSERSGLKLLALAACLCLMTPPIAGASAAEPLLHAHACGTLGGQLPIDRKRVPAQDCPSACHATCPRKQAAGEGDDSNTG